MDISHMVAQKRDEISSLLNKAPGLEEIGTAALRARGSGTGFGQQIDAMKKQKLVGAQAEYSMLNDERGAQLQERQFGLQQEEMAYKRLQMAAEKGNAGAKRAKEAFDSLTEGMDPPSKAKLLQAAEKGDEIASDGSNAAEIYSRLILEHKLDKAKTPGTLKEVYDTQTRQTTFASDDDIRVSGGRYVPKPDATTGTAYTDVGKIDADFRAGRITLAQRDKMLADLTSGGGDPTKDLGKGWTYGPDRTPQIIPRGPAAMDRADAIAKPYNTQAAEVADAVTGLRTMADYVKDDTGGGDIALVYNFFRALEPNGRVTEGEFEAAGKTMNLPGRILMALSDVDGKKKILSVEAKKELFNAAKRAVDQRVGSLERQYESTAEDIRPYDPDVDQYIRTTPYSLSDYADMDLDTAVNVDISTLTPKQKKYLERRLKELTQ